MFIVFIMGPYPGSLPRYQKKKNKYILMSILDLLHIGNTKVFVSCGWNYKMVYSLWKTWSGSQKLIIELPTIPSTGAFPQKLKKTGDLWQRPVKPTLKGQRQTNEFQACLGSKSAWDIWQFPELKKNQSLDMKVNIYSITMTKTCKVLAVVANACNTNTQ